MANMSYCRWENTAHDLRDCLEVFTNEEYEISSGEVRHGIKMFEYFLDFCEGEGIIEEYNKESIRTLFEEYNQRIADYDSDES